MKQVKLKREPAEDTDQRQEGVVASKMGSVAEPVGPYVIYFLLMNFGLAFFVAIVFLLLKLKFGGWLSYFLIGVAGYLTQRKFVDEHGRPLLPAERRSLAWWVNIILIAIPSFGAFFVIGVENFAGQADTLRGLFPPLSIAEAVGVVLLVVILQYFIIWFSISSYGVRSWRSHGKDV